MFTLGCLLQINQKTSPRSQKEPEKVTGKQLVSLRERLFQTIKNPLGEDLSRVSFPTELLVCSVHLFPREKKDQMSRGTQLEAAYLLFHLPIGAQWMRWFYGEGKPGGGV